MKYILIIFLILIIKIILTKILSLLEILISFAIKGKQLKKDIEEWNKYFKNISDTFAIKYFIIVYISASIISCIICYFITRFFNINYELIIILAIFIITLILTIIKFKIKDNNYITQKINKLKKDLENN